MSIRGKDGGKAETSKIFEIDFAFSKFFESGADQIPSFFRLYRNVW